MLKRLLVGTGRFDDARRAALEAEGVLLLVEERKGARTWRNYRGPDRIASYRREGLYPAFAITQRRVVADQRGGRTFLDVPFDDPAAAGLTADDDDGTLVVTWDCALLGEGRSGTQQLRIGTPDAGRAVALLRERGVRPA